MKRLGFVFVAMAIVSLLLPAGAFAQDDANQIIFAIYYRCNQAKEVRADEIYRQIVAPVAQKHVDLGHLTTSLWLSHNQGGPWRRIWAVLGTDMNQMMDVRAAIVEELGSKNAAEMNELQEACSSHDDYIWTGIAVSPTTSAGAVGNASISTYHSCDMSREARADEIFSQVLAPLYKKHTDMGHLTSWGYYSHRMGGMYRRLETLSGADHKTLLSMQNAIYQEAFENNALAMAEFRSICSGHSDYMWENASQP
ncbi:MAG TPA: hypothetical protein VEK15_02395 [Vicinamibacteria bacterium]|nr:hypothetical protein [Vicinamibacteria bacterium]